MKKFINLAALFVAFGFANFTSNFISAPATSALETTSTVTLIVGESAPPTEPTNPPADPPSSTSTNPAAPNTGHQTSSPSSASAWQGTIIIIAAIIFIVAAVVILIRHRRSTKLSLPALLPLVFSVSALTALAALTLTACGQSGQSDQPSRSSQSEQLDQSGQPGQEQAQSAQSQPQQAQPEPGPSRYASDDDPELTFSIGDPVELSYNAELGGIYFGSQTISVQTNNTDGYSLFINTLSDHGALTSATSNNVVTPVSATIADPSDLTDNTWGFIPLQFAFGYPEYLFFAPVPTAGPPGSVTAIHVTATPNELDDVNQIYFGAKITDNFPADTYSATIVYTILANSEPPDNPI